MTFFTKLDRFLLAVLCAASLQAAILPYGCELEVRLLHQVGSRVSHVGDPVEASVITPVLDHGTLILPAGAAVSGVVDHIDRLGLGLRHTTARLDLHFTQLRLSDGTAVAIDARVSSVEAAREAVRTDGAIIGINPTANFSTGVSFVYTLFYFGEPEFRLPLLGFKFLAARSPDAEIAFPAGTEMLLRLAGNVELHTPASHVGLPLLTAHQIANVQDILARLPRQQTNRSGDRPADLVNILLIGSQSEVNRGFHAAGWGGAERHGVLALYRMFHCAVERKGYSRAPMTELLLNGSRPDSTFQKSLDTFAKRHHIRLWHDAQSGAWLGAATEDVSYKVHKMRLTHATDRRIDNERAKVVNDLVFTGCVDSGALLPRASLKPVPEYGNTTIMTDGDIAVLQLNSCDSPRLMPSDPQKPSPVRAIRAAYAVAEDIARSNPVSVGYALTKSLLDNAKVNANQRIQAARVYTRSTAVASVSAPTADGSLAVR